MGNFRDALARCLLGCDSQELGTQDTVYGIVTNYKVWTFVRCSRDKVELHECFLHYSKTGPDQESLKGIVGKLNAILSED